jgi:hypothetical protein
VQGALVVLVDNFRAPTHLLVRIVFFQLLHQQAAEKYHLVRMVEQAALVAVVALLVELLHFLTEAQEQQIKVMLAEIMVLLIALLMVQAAVAERVQLVLMVVHHQMAQAEME